jgi:hypothetical protein
MLHPIPPKWQSQPAEDKDVAMACYVTTGTFTQHGFGLMSLDKALGGVWL